MTNPIPSSDLDALVERLRQGVTAIGLHNDNSTELFDIEDANDAMAEAATAITSLRNQLTASEARESELLEFVKTLALRDDSIGDDARNALKEISP